MAVKRFVIPTEVRQRRMQWRNLVPSVETHTIVGQILRLRHAALGMTITLFYRRNNVSPKKIAQHNLQNNDSRKYYPEFEFPGFMPE